MPLPVTLEDHRAVVRGDHAVPQRHPEKRPAPYEGLMQRFRGEYLEMPGLRLTLEQAQRLFSVERNLCAGILGELVKENFLIVKPNGTYARLTDGAYPRPRPARADLTGDHLVARAR